MSTERRTDLSSRRIFKQHTIKHLSDSCIYYKLWPVLPRSAPVPQKCSGKYSPFCTTRPLECITTRISQAATQRSAKGTPLVYPFFDPTSPPHSLPLRHTMAEPRKILIPYPTPAVYTCPLCRVEFKQALKHYCKAQKIVQILNQIDIEYYRCPSNRMISLLLVKTRMK